MSKHEEDVELKSKELQDVKVCRLHVSISTSVE